MTRSKAETNHPANRYGSDAKFRKYVQTQPCCVCGGWAEYHQGAFRSQAAHVRRASTSGTGFKPPYACVPMCFECHHEQHKQGEFVLLTLYGKASTPPEAKEWFEDQADLTLAGWIATRK